jgi:hypothetical protein
MFTTVSNFNVTPTTNEPMELYTFNLTQGEITDMPGNDK